MSSKINTSYHSHDLDMEQKAVVKASTWPYQIEYESTENMKQDSSNNEAERVLEKQKITIPFLVEYTANWHTILKLLKKYVTRSTC